MAYLSWTTPHQLPETELEIVISTWIQDRHFSLSLSYDSLSQFIDHVAASGMLEGLEAAVTSSCEAEAQLVLSLSGQLGATYG
jgi:hypothetical protein